jgi:hypothetical protein
LSYPDINYGNIAQKMNSSTGIKILKNKRKSGMTNPPHKKLHNIIYDNAQDKPSNSAQIPKNKITIPGVRGLHGPSPRAGWH